ncbi:DNA repair protein RecN [Polluticoccus soli]|uniref:DNA repair protein RecN n=1 Tax=Polluticoccus soli TaxID=3034150 RepID=UPI0023E12333|nr:DNA repair protein RecN [Flavipsychrobacter sp. JY13-12]
MLQKLIINNYAIIDHLVIEPDTRLSTVTGETGAGKSIILGALSLILGERADTTVLIKKDEKCVVEAHFDVKNNNSFKAALLDEELDDEPQCIIRREISSAGKSRAFVNDTPVTLNVLNRLTSMLVDLHQQFDHLALEDDHFQMDVIDAVAKNGDLRKRYTDLYRQFRKLAEEIASKKTQQEQWQKESDYKQYLLNELTEAAFKENEIEETEQQLKQLGHAEKILNVLQLSRMTLEEGEQPLVNELKRINQQLQGIAEVMPASVSLQERLASAHAELKDIAGELQDLESKVSLDPELMQQMQERQDLGYKLFKKHAVQTTADLLQLQLQLEADLQSSLDLNNDIEKLQQQRDTVFKQLLAEAEKMSAARQKAAPEISDKVTGLLALVGMPNARFEIQLRQASTPGAYGVDEIQFMLDANKSGQLVPVHKAASGGEMSRIMLCIKSLTAKAMHLPTLIFDEVDTGISGEAARQVGILLRDLAQYHQVLCITHQPQVAAKGITHFYVYKDSANAQRITTKVKVLQQDERVLAIARMIGGEQPSDAAMQNARELVTV